MFRSRSWFGSGWIRPKKRLSLEHLKYLCGILEKNTHVSENNRGLLVESLRCIAEILIWGDQHDSSVFDFFLEKNMLSYFLHIMRQKSGGSSYVCVQLLQTLNILFENIRNQTSLYYLLSNNHVNSIMVHKFDFSDEDVMGYYILFLKTLSLKLNAHTIHFFYNEHTNDFPLYTEAIKFFNHPESMVRIAVRTISLNVYKVENDSMLNFIRNKTAAPYFSNLVWFIGKHILELDACVRTDFDHQSNQKLSNLVAEHLDHLHYLNDILLLEIHDLNAVLTEHLLHKLFIPLYILSLTPAPPLSMALVTHNLAAVLNKVVEIEIEDSTNPRVSSVVALYLLSLVFLVITHGPLVHALAWVILNADQNVFIEGATEILNAYDARREIVAPGFAKPKKSLEEALGSVASAISSTTNSVEINVNIADNSNSATHDETQRIIETMHGSNITDEEKEKFKRIVEVSASDVLPPILDVVLSSLDCSESDYLPLLSLCLIYAIVNNKSVHKDWLDQILTHTRKSPRTYKAELIESLLNIINLFYQPSYRIRLVTLEMSLELLYTLTTLNTNSCCISDCQLHTLSLALNQAMSELRHFFKSEEMFLDIFENDFDEIKKSSLNVEFLCMDSTILLPPTGTPLTGIHFTRRLPCGEVEKARRAIQGFFLIRRTCQKFFNETEAVLPLTNAVHCVQVDNVLDLNNSDLIACTVLTKDNTKQRRFLVIDSLQLILVEPDAKLLGWGIAKLVGFLQDVEVVGDKDDSRCLHITIHRGGMSHNCAPLLSAKFVFDDHIRCMAAKQRLTKGRSKARQRKMYQIAQLLEVSNQETHPTAISISSNRAGCTTRNTREHSQIFLDTSPFPGFAAALGKEKFLFSGRRYTNVGQNQLVERINDDKNRRSRCRSSNSSSGFLSESEELVSNSLRRKSSSSSPENCKNWSLRSREASVRKLRPTSEDIPLEDLHHSSISCPHSRSSSNNSSRSPTARSKNEFISFKTASPNEPSLHSQPKSAVLVNPDAFVSSEETSFISQEVRKQQKGIVEIV